MLTISCSTRKPSSGIPRRNMSGGMYVRQVINGRYQLEMRRPLFPRKQTWIGPARAGKLGEFQRFSPGGLFGLSFNFLRMNQAHRSAAKFG
jgi:hypothetical protein